MRISKKRESGMITVEGVLCLVPFIILIVGIISLINVYMVHNRIQYALQEMGSELTAYTYFYQVLGLRDADDQVRKDFAPDAETLEKNVAKISEFMTDLESVQSGAAVAIDDTTGVLDSQSVDEFLENTEKARSDWEKEKENIEKAKASGGEAEGIVKNYISDPKQILREIIALGIQKGVSAVKTQTLALITGSLMRLYLDMSFSESQSMTADEYLKFYGVKDGLDGLDFSQSKFFEWGDDGGSKVIDMVVEYKIEIHILKLFMKDPTITVVQRCTVPAWLDGDGVHYEEGD